MRQYLEVKAQYPDAILMFRMGDFYEMFFEDAVEVGPVLDIAVTTRDRNAEDPVPMAGVPFHAVGHYLRTLVERGYKVAVCEQMESPEEARRRKGPDKIVRRQVVRVVTPGALLDDEHLARDEPNFLLAVQSLGEPGEGAALAALDISSAEFWVETVPDAPTLRAEVLRLCAREILTDPATAQWLRAELSTQCPRVDVEGPPPDAHALARPARLAEESGIGPLSAAEARAAARVLAYAQATQPGQTLLLHRLRRHDPAGHLILDETSLRNLEVFSTIRDGRREGSLCWAVDATRTAMGARLLRAWIGAPRRDRSVVAARLDGIEALLAEPGVRAEVYGRLGDVRDVARLAARARLRTIHPRELGALRDSLRALPDLRRALSTLAERRIDRAVPPILDLGEDLLGDLEAELSRVLVGDPPAVARDGGMIRPGADPALDEQRSLRDGGREALAEIERRERERTGIASLKVRHNNIFGYFIEVTRVHLARVPAEYVRKQTVANAERFVTEELAGLEARVLGAQAAALARELELFEALRERVSQDGERLVELADRLAALDVIAGLARVAHEHDWVRPELVEAPVLDIVDGRHAVVERMLPRGRFVPNGVRLEAGAIADPGRLWVITGPNMGGKSTVMRQVALITILAHMGSFVPARTATVGICDRIFTRVGAADDLGRGESTFMVEMRETGQILAQATSRSLVLLDEIGRGTATYDGLALAWAITEYLHDQVGCRTLFATHYHALCTLSDRLAGVRNVHVAVHEQRGAIVFLHHLEPGPSGRSFGIQVGRLAGLPAGVLRRATKILERLEARDRAGTSQLDMFAPAVPVAPGSAPDEAAADLAADLRALELDDLSPRAAHDWLRAWRRRLE
jgi:DNA mismatch repair protein MutS